MVYYIKPSADIPCSTQPCLTLEQFSALSIKSNLSLTLEFLPGNHGLASQLTIQNISLLSMFSDTKNVNIVCDQFASFDLTNVGFIIVKYLTFYECGERFTSGRAVFSIFFSSLTISGCTFFYSKVRVFYVQQSNISINECVFSSSYSGVLYAEQSEVHDNGSIYYNTSYTNNVSITESILLMIKSSVSIFSVSKLHMNRAIGMVVVTNGTLILNQCEMANNSVYYVLYADNSTIIANNNSFKSNSMVYSLLIIVLSNFTVSNTTIANNIAARRDLMYFTLSKVQSYHSFIIIGNKAEAYSTVYLEESMVNISGKLEHNANFGTFFISNSEVIFFSASTFSNCASASITSPYIGGAVKSVGSTLHFVGSASFLNNYSFKDGGAISASGSRLHVYGEVVIANNVAQNSGGGLYLYQSLFLCLIHCSFSGNTASEGGAVHAIYSDIYLGNQIEECINKSMNASLLFINNYAKQGGGLSLEANTKLYGPRKRSCKFEIVFDYNVALIGEAIYIDDYTNLGACSRKYQAQCFLQTSLPGSHCDGFIRIHGSNTKTTLFGGLLDRCIVNNEFTDVNYMKGIMYLESATTNTNISGLITSDPIQVCYCKGIETDCHHKFQSLSVKKGEEFTITLAAVDQVGHPIKATINSRPRLNDSFLSEGQQTQIIPSECSNVSFNVYSRHDSVELLISTSGPCEAREFSQTIVHINFTNCVCPIGFQVLYNHNTDCKCDCDSRIKPYLSTCNTSHVVRNSNIWIDYIKDEGFFFHPECPYDYCLPPTLLVQIYLNGPVDESAVQCAFNRSGLLCGTCKPGFTLSLSSSRCILCQKSQWPRKFAAIVIGSFIAGIVLVAATLVLNLTVGLGTLNGLIFYANILAADTRSFLPLSEPSFFSVFIAWLNLDIGFDTCLFKGMDMYARTWLQFVFPTQVVTMLVLMILVSKYSAKFAQLIGKYNPVATLATLLLLSYTKILRATIEILSFAIIVYPDGRHKVVWLPDASIGYIKSKHFPLFLTGIITITIGLTYTVLLFSWQWLLKSPNKWVFKWITNTRLNLFMEANLAPYKANYRYWTGLLLFIRIILYLGIATGLLSKNTTVSLTIGMMAAGLLLFKGCLGNNIYRKNFLGYQDSFCYFNLLFFSLARLYYQNNNLGQVIIAKISIGIAFILFLLILFYHILCTVLEIRCFSYLLVSVKKRMQRIKVILKLGDVVPQETEMQAAAVITPTSTEVSLLPHCPSVAHKNVSKDDSCTTRQSQASRILPISKKMKFSDSTYSSYRLQESLLQDV